MEGSSADNARQTGPALKAMYRLILWLIQTVENFFEVRSSCSGIGSRVQPSIFWSGQIEATCTKSRRLALLAANLGLEKLSFLFRLATELEYLDLRRYGLAARAGNEMGRLVGGCLIGG